MKINYKLKKSLIKNYIINNNLLTKFETKRNKYTLDIYLDAYLMFEKYNHTYDTYTEYLNLFYPKRTQLHSFIKKMTKYKIFENIYKCEKPKNSDILSIDSTFIINKCNSDTAKINSHYYNKKGIKVTAIVDES